MTSKPELRKQVSAKRRARSPEAIQIDSRLIRARLLTLPDFTAANRIALYKAFGGEVDLDPLFQKLWDAGIKTCIPVFNPTRRMYEFGEIDKTTRFTAGHYQIPEPERPLIIDANQVGIILVPGVAFDPAGNRLGRGGGYYDRLLNGFRGISVAVAFDFQLVEHIPCEKHDIPVDMIITPTKHLKACNEH